MVFHFQDPSTKKLPISTFMEEVRPAVKEKWEFQFRDMSKLLYLFALLDN